MPNNQNAESKNPFAGFSEEDEIIQSDNTAGEAKPVEKTEEKPETTETVKPEVDVAGNEGASNEDGKEEKTAEEIAAEKEAGKETGKEVAEFDPENAELVLETVEEKKEVEADGQINYLEMAKMAGITIEEDITSLDRNEYAERLNEHIESSKQKFSYKDIPEENHDIIKYFSEEGGSVEDLLSDNDVVVATALLNMNDKEKYLMSRTDALVRAGLDKDEANERALEDFEEMSENDLAQATRAIDQDLLAYKKEALRNQIDRRNSLRQQELQRANVKAQAQQKQMVNTLNSMNQFMGMKLTPDVKAAIARDIETGQLDKTLDTSIGKAKVESYLLAKFGKQIMDYQQKLIQTKTAQSYNKGVGKFIDKNHNVAPETREQNASSGKTGKWSGLENVD